MPVAGEARGIMVQIGDWWGAVSFMVVPMDDYNMVLGLRWFYQVGAFSVPYSVCLMLFNEEGANIIPAKWEAKRLVVILAMQFNRGLACCEEAFTAFAMPNDDEDEPKGMAEVPKEVQNVYDEFKDVMSNELPKKLPPRRDVDHWIELVIESMLPSCKLYQMVPAKLKELQRQLKDQLDAGMIQPSKSSYGSLVLFQKKHDRSLRMCVDN